MASHPSPYKRFTVVVFYGQAKVKVEVTAKAMREALGNVEQRYSGRVIEIKEKHVRLERTA